MEMSAELKAYIEDQEKREAYTKQIRLLGGVVSYKAGHLISHLIQTCQDKIVLMHVAGILYSIRVFIWVGEISDPISDEYMRIYKLHQNTCHPDYIEPVKYILTWLAHTYTNIYFVNENTIGCFDVLNHLIKSWGITGKEVDEYKAALKTFGEFAVIKKEEN